MINVVYHCTGTGNWQDVVVEQFESLKRSGLTCIFATHVGEGVQWFQEQALRQGIDMRLVHHHDDVKFAKFHALLVVEYLARQSDWPLLYFHTKGVNHYDALGRGQWRRLMQKHVVENWQENIISLDSHDAVGVNWLTCDGELWIPKPAWKRPHFSGSFWMARADWIRKLPPFAHFHEQLKELACEVWIGAAPGCKHKSLACEDKPLWEAHFDWDRLEMPRMWKEM